MAQEQIENTTDSALVYVICFFFNGVDLIDFRNYAINETNGVGRPITIHNCSSTVDAE